MYSQIHDTPPKDYIGCHHLRAATDATFATPTMPNTKQRARLCRFHAARRLASLAPSMGSTHLRSAHNRLGTVPHLTSLATAVSSTEELVSRSLATAGERAPSTSPVRDAVLRVALCAFDTAFMLTSTHTYVFRTVG